MKLTRGSPHLNNAPLCAPISEAARHFLIPENYTKYVLRSVAIPTRLAFLRTIAHKQTLSRSCKETVSRAHPS